MAQSRAKDPRAKLMIYPSWADMLIAAPPEYCQRLFTVMWQYRNGASYESLDLDPITATLFAGVKSQLDLDMQDYMDRNATKYASRKSIYFIRDRINDKAYVGQSCDPIRRWAQHASNREDSLIGAAIQKYGVENFDFEILEQGVENYDEREHYWIETLDTVAPNGYNRNR